MDGLLLLKKEQEMTSHDLVNIVRRQINQKRVGHTGTLDPNATGLMVIAIGKSTKLVNYLQKDSKEYILEMKLGVLTDTLDIWGEVIEEKPIKRPSEVEFKEVLNKFLGKQMQKPPMYSAIKHKGRKLYELARAGESIDVPEREIEIYNIELLDYNETIKIKVSCSSGTYIRSLCLSIGEQFNTYATMTALVRTKVGKFTLDQAYSIAELKDNQFKLINKKDALSNYPTVEYDNLSDIKNGRKITLETDHDLVLISVDNQIMAFYKRVESNLFRSKRGLW